MRTHPDIGLLITSLLQDVMTFAVTCALLDVKAKATIKNNELLTPKIMFVPSSHPKALQSNVFENKRTLKTRCDVFMQARSGDMPECYPSSLIAES